MSIYKVALSPHGKYLIYSTLAKLSHSPPFMIHFSLTLQVFSEKACSTSLRDMLDLVALDLKNNHQSEMGAKQSFNYDVSSQARKLNTLHKIFQNKK